MDWARAKTILIISFLTLNSLLGYQLWMNNATKTEWASISFGVKEDVERLMESKSIRLEAEIPKETPKMRYLFVETTKKPGFDPVKIRIIKPGIKVDRNWSEKDLIVALDYYIEDIAMYQPDSLSIKNNKYTFWQTENGAPLFEIKLELIMDQDEIKGYRQNLVDVLQSGSEQTVISGYSAVRTLVETYLDEKSVIQDVRLGYYGQTYNADTRVLAPYWRVVLGEGKIFYVHAITGAVEVSN